MGKRVNFGLARYLFTVMIIISQLYYGKLWGLDPDKRVDQYLVDQWGITNGIPSDTIRSIAQTPDGYLWIGTSKGLVRFDGIKFLPICFSESTNILSQEIRSLFVDREGSLWIGSPTDLTSYRSQTGRFKTYSRDDGITADGIRRLKDDIKGNLWISFTASHVNRFSKGKFSAFNESHGLLGKKINTIVEDSKGNLLFGTRENGVFIYNDKDEKFQAYPIVGLENLHIITMFEDRKGGLWIGTTNGLFQATDKSTEKYTVGDGLTSDFITCITEDSDWNLWIGTIKGLNRIKRKRDGAIYFESLLKPFPINCLYEDREKSLWIGTDNSGIRRVKDSKFISYAPIKIHPEERPISIFEDRDGDTWIGSHSGKLLRYRGSEFVESIEPPELSGTAIAAIAEDGAGNLWLGTTGKGVFCIKNNTFSQYTTREGLADNLVTSIYRDSRDNLWFSTFDGVSVLRSRSGIIESLKSEDGLSGKVVHNVYEDKILNIWIAADKGISIIKNGKFTRGNIIKYLQDITVACIYEDVDSPAGSPGVFWIATHGAGLKRFHQGKFLSYTTAEGMTTDFIYQFLEDQRGDFWLMSDSGILRVGKNDLNRFVKGRGDKINCTSFGFSDGMKSLEFDNIFSRNSALKTRNGAFWFITKKGISIVNPAKIRLNKIPPPVVIEKVFFNDQPIPLHLDKGSFPCKGIRNFSFHFTAPTFLSPGKVRFKYQVQGFDRGWLFLLPGEERVAHYKDLRPGAYTFRVTACNSEGVWNPGGDSLTFTLEPLFHQTILFKIAALLFFLALLAAVFFIYKKRPFKKRAKYKGSPLHPDFAEECIKKLKQLMEKEKVYTDAHISLQSLAQKLSISPHLLSQVLNERLNRNFPDFINSYRIEEAKMILKSAKGAQQKIDAVAIEVGFNTTVAFYRAFKKFTDITPTRYKERVKS